MGTCNRGYVPLISISPRHLYCKGSNAYSMSKKVLMNKKTSAIQLRLIVNSSID